MWGRGKLRNRARCAQGGGRGRCIERNIPALPPPRPSPSWEKALTSVAIRSTSNYQRGQKLESLRGNAGGRFCVRERPKGSLLTGRDASGLQSRAPSHCCAASPPLHAHTPQRQPEHCRGHRQKRRRTGQSATPTPTTTAVQAPSRSTHTAPPLQLNANENVYGAPAEVLADLVRAPEPTSSPTRHPRGRRQAAATHWVYPDPTQLALRTALAEHHAAHGIDKERVVAGAGSDDILDILMRLVVRRRLRPPLSSPARSARTRRRPRRWFVGVLAPPLPPPPHPALPSQVISTPTFGM